MIISIGCSTLLRNFLLYTILAPNLQYRLSEYARSEKSMNTKLGKNCKMSIEENCITK